jgi:hypothetical protein
VSSELSFEGGGNQAVLTVRMSGRARAMRLRVDPRTCAVVLTVPSRFSRRKALAWAADKRAWIEAALAQVPPRSTIGPGSIVPLFGVDHRVDWSPERSRLVRLERGRMVTGGPEAGLEMRLHRWVRRHAAELLTRETHEFAAKAGVGVTKVAVGDPVSRWGSCSASGAIRYSWRLVLAPDWVRRATVAHEVAHRVHMNHSRAFHVLVAELLETDPAPAGLWLRRNGAGLHQVFRS